MALNPDDTLSNGHYRIQRLLGRGGFGFVYEARDTLLNEKVVGKAPTRRWTGATIGCAATGTPFMLVRTQA